MEWILYCSIGCAIIIVLVLFAYSFDKVYAFFEPHYSIKDNDELKMWDHINQTLSSPNFLTTKEKSLTEEEKYWLQIRHDELYANGWYSVDPLSAKQIQLLMYEHIKHMIKDDTN